EEHFRKGGALRPWSGGVLAQVCGHQVEDAGRFAHRLRRSLRGQSWAEKSLKNGRILVEFQNLRKPQDAKGTYFPRNSPSTLPEWGSGGRWFESSRPDMPEGATQQRVATNLPASFLYRPDSIGQAWRAGLKKMTPTR